MDLLFQGHCHIGAKLDIEVGEIDVIPEGLRCVVDLNISNSEMILCLDNENAIRALAGGPTEGRKYVRACPEDVKILQERPCKIRGKWTLSHMGGISNERTNTLAKERIKDASCR